MAKAPGRWAVPRHAVIDVGSNSVRLVVFADGRRVPLTLHNEKVSAKLGKTLQEDGKMPAKGMDIALRGLARFAAVIEAIGVEDVTVVATAAVRDASNGPEFLARIRELGLDPKVLSGREEAAASASGVLCAFPDARGVVADLGGGSLELVEIGGGRIGGGVTLPLGTLRLARMRQVDGPQAPRKMRALITRDSAKGMAKGGALYVVGGAWRALAQYAMHEAGWPLRSSHGYCMPASGITHLVNVLAHTPPRTLQKIKGISASRVSSLGDAARVLSALVRHLQPDRVVASSFGLREGLMFNALPSSVRQRDPLIADVEDEYGPATGDSIYGAPVAEWIAPACTDADDAEADRLRHAAGLLAMPLLQSERLLRRARGTELALHERWIGIDSAGRARVAAALLATAGERDLPGDVHALATPEQLEAAFRWGCLIRFAVKFSGGSASLLAQSRLRRDGDRLILTITGSRALYGEAAEQHFLGLAERLGAVPEVRFA